MLRSLRISSLGVIDDAELEFGPGLNVITGETGAGKTMVVTGLGLLLGSRADTALVRTGAEAAVVEGEVDVPPSHVAAQRVASAGGDAHDGLILVRTLSAIGRSRAHVGGRAAPVSVLAEVGEHVVALHGQADQWRLRDGDQHRVWLDDFAGKPVRDALADFQQAYRKWTDLRRELTEVSASTIERAREAQMLRTALAEIGSVAPQAGEEDELLEQESRLAHADALRSAAREARAHLAGDDERGDQVASALDLLGQAGSALTTVSHHDERLAQLNTRVSEATYLASDVASDLSMYAEGVDGDPARLASVQQRRATLTALLRSYGASTVEVRAWAVESAERLERLEGSEDRIAELTKALATTAASVGVSGGALTVARVSAAGALGERVTTELRALAMGSAVIEVAVTSREVETSDERADVVRVEEGAFLARSSGLDDVEIRLSANPGAAPRSITKAASGGELSRVMLALELVSAHAHMPTYVFDEVDAGVGGAAAVDLGARLAQLAQTAQVIVVTHLGQVAAYADRHLVVRKTSESQITSAGVHVVESEDRVAEVARMIGGETDSTAGLAHARELLKRHTRVQSRIGAADPAAQQVT